MQPVDEQRSSSPSPRSAVARSAPAAAATALGDSVPEVRRRTLTVPRDASGAGATAASTTSTDRRRRATTARRRRPRDDDGGTAAPTDRDRADRRRTADRRHRAPPAARRDAARHARPPRRPTSTGNGGTGGGFSDFCQQNPGACPGPARGERLLRRLGRAARRRDERRAVGQARRAVQAVVLRQLADAELRRLRLRCRRRCPSAARGAPDGVAAEADRERRRPGRHGERDD